MKENKMKTAFRKLLVSAAFIGTIFSANAETIKLIVPVPPGALVDNLARLMGVELGKKLNESVIVENKPGASGSIATSFAAAATPNGQTMVIGNLGTISMYPVLNPDFNGFNAKSFAPVCLIGGGPLVLYASGGIPANNFKELLQYFKENPATASWGSPGVGTGPHLLGEQLKSQYKINSMVHILYKGMAPAQVDLIANRLSLVFDSYSTNMAGLISVGKVKPIFVTDSKMLGTISAAPDASFYVKDWFGLFVPAGTPEIVLKKLQTACDSVVNEVAIKEKLTTMGTPPLNVKPSDAQDYIDSEKKKWISMISKLNLNDK
jgi:tripartite-type tricarboxylate transporter receptor subunit TctC